MHSFHSTRNIPRNASLHILNQSSLRNGFSNTIEKTNCKSKISKSFLHKQFSSRHQHQIVGAPWNKSHEISRKNFHTDSFHQFEVDPIRTTVQPSTSQKNTSEPKFNVDIKIPVDPTIRIAHESSRTSTDSNVRINIDFRNTTESRQNLFTFKDMEQDSNTSRTLSTPKIQKMTFEELHNHMSNHSGYDEFELISRMIEEHPNESFLYRYRAQTHVSMHSYYDALRDLDKAIELAEQYTQEKDISFYERALVKAYLNRPISSTNDIMEIHNKTPMRVVTLASWLNSSSKTAIKYLDTVLQNLNEGKIEYNDEDLMWFYFIRGKNLEILEKYEEAFEAYKLAATYNNEELQVGWQRAGWCCQRMGRHEEAIQFFGKYLSRLQTQEKLKTYYETLFSRAYSYFAMKQWELASADYENIIKHSENRRLIVFAMINRAFLNFRLGHHAASLLDLRGAIMLDPTNIAAYHLRCHVYEHTKRNTLAKNDIQAIIELIHHRAEYSDCPKVFVARLFVKLARLYLEDPPTRHTYLDAMQNVSKALEQEAQLPEALEMRIHILMKQYPRLLQKSPTTEEYHDLIMKDLEYLISTQLDPGRFHYVRGIIHYQNKRYKEASEDFNKCNIDEVESWPLIYHRSKSYFFQGRLFRSTNNLYNGWKAIKSLQQKNVLTSS